MGVLACFRGVRVCLAGVWGCVAVVTGGAGRDGRFLDAVDCTGWAIDRLRVATNRASGIVNDPNRLGVGTVRR